MAKKKKRSAPTPIARPGAAAAAAAAAVAAPGDPPPMKKAKSSPAPLPTATHAVGSAPGTETAAAARAPPSSGLSAAAKKKKKKKAAVQAPGAASGSLDSVLEFNPPDSATRASAALSWLVAPHDPKTFLTKHWQQSHLLIPRPAQPDYYKSLYSSKHDILEPINSGALRLTADYTVSGYNPESDEKWTLDSSEIPAGDSALETAKVNEALASGGSIRVLRPQDFSTRVCDLLSALEEAWDVGVAGANSYLTPPPDPKASSTGQGFAPHYDDVDVFILQLEGSKRWRLYPPTQDEEVLARFSSDDFSPDELDDPILDHVLQPGDLLYFPRGTIHQAVTVSPNTPSLHLTLSTGQLQTWADYLGTLLTAALEQAESEHVELRQNLPRHWSRSMGVLHSDSGPSEARAEFAAALRAKLDLVFKDPPTDAAADHMAAAYISNRHCSTLHPSALRTAISDSKTATKAAMAALEEDGLLDSEPGSLSLATLPPAAAAVFHSGTTVKLQGRDLFRLQVVSEEEVVLTTPGGREDALPVDVAPVIEAVVAAYPQAVSLEALLANEDNPLDLLSLLELLDVLLDRNLVYLQF